jgi:DhnA family fructose-bisphosphate aldolase class Ia
LSADYVERETRRAVEGVNGTATQIWPGIDIDVPVAAGASHCTPEGVRAAVTAVFHGGAQGIILSRNYTEMKPENLAAAGAALQDLGRR